jgi:hypothetical protein
MITDAATPASPALTRPAATPNAQVRSPSIDYAIALRRIYVPGQTGSLRLVSKSRTVPVLATCSAWAAEWWPSPGRCTMTG